MRAVVLAAGHGRRLGALTELVPKPLLPLGGTSILKQNLSLLASAGVTEVAINLHHRAGTIRGTIGDGSGFGISISYSYERELLGTALGTRQAASLLVPTWPLLVVYGDNLIRLKLKDMYRFHGNARSAVTIAVHEVADIRESGSVHFDQDGRIQRFIEKPHLDGVVGGWVNAGVYLLDESALDTIPSDRPSDFGLDIFPSLIQQGFDVFAYCLRGPNEAVYSIDTHQKYLEAVALLAKQTDSKRGPGAPG